VPFTTTAVVSEENGRRGREAGNNGFRMGRVRLVGLEGEVGGASGDETRGRLVLIMTDSAVFGANRKRQVRQCGVARGIWGYN
jgi:hypothetical protein